MTSKKSAKLPPPLPQDLYKTNRGFQAISNKAGHAGLSIALSLCDLEIVSSSTTLQAGDRIAECLSLARLAGRLLQAGDRDWADAVFAQATGVLS